jgi:hypothetical protein
MSFIGHDIKLDPSLDNVALERKVGESREVNSMKAYMVRLFICFSKPEINK